MFLKLFNVVVLFWSVSSEQNRYSEPVQWQGYCELDEEVYIYSNRSYRYMSLLEVKDGEGVTFEFFAHRFAHMEWKLIPRVGSFDIEFADDRKLKLHPANDCSGDKEKIIVTDRVQYSRGFRGETITKRLPVRSFHYDTHTGSLTVCNKCVYVDYYGEMMAAYDCSKEYEKHFTLETWYEQDRYEDEDEDKD